MSDLISRIDSRIREIQGLLGEPEVPKGTTGKSASRVAFDLGLGSPDGKLGFGSLPAIGDLKVIGLGDRNSPVGPFEPDALRSLAQKAIGKANPKLDALSAVLDAETDQSSGKAGDISSLLSMGSLTQRTNSKSALHLPSSGLPVQGLLAPDPNGTLKRALEAYRAGTGSAKPRTEETLPK